MDLAGFRKKVKEVCQPTGYSLKMLARELGLQPSALSNKLNGTGETSLKHIEVRQIIKILAQWEAIAYQSEAIELLQMAGLTLNSFSPEEWTSPPLNKLTVKPEIVNTNRLEYKEPFTGPLPAKSNAQVSEPLPKLSGPRLPLMPTTLIGRQTEITEVVQRLQQPEVRLLTLTGSGGVGKTRLAVEIAARLKEDFPDGVFFVSLAALRDPGLVLSNIARALGIRESGALNVVSMLKNYISDKVVLLVLDNFEQVLAASGAIKELLADLPNLKVLITSRILLRVYGEYEYLVPPLALPQLSLQTYEKRLSFLPQAGDYEAIALFAQRAGSTNSGFKITVDNIQAVVEICQRLDGLPLAIELAAARTKILRPQQILERLAHRLELLNRGSQDLPQRHQTLRALLDWSFDLLEPAEKNLLLRLSVFAGSCDLKAVMAVCRDEDKDLDFDSSEIEYETLDLLSDLADKSMLQLTTTSDGEPRFSMLETMREYALEKLRTGGTEGILRKRQAFHFLKLAEDAEKNLATNQQKAWLDRLETEHDNFRAVLDWATGQAGVEYLDEKSYLLENKTGVATTGRIEITGLETALKVRLDELGLSLVGLLAWFWDAHGHLSEGRFWLDKALEQSRNQGRKNQKNDNGMAEPAEEPGSYLRLKAKALNAAGNLARKQGDYDCATTLLVEALGIRQSLELPLEISQTLNNLGVSAYHNGNQEQAQKFYEESLAIKYKLGDKRSIGLSLNNLAELVRERGENDRAITLFEESLDRLREVGDIQNVAAVLLNLGKTISDKGDLHRAGSVLIESLRLFGELGDRFHIAETLESIAGLATNLEQPVVAAHLFGAASSLRQAIGAPVGQNYRSRHEYSVQYFQSKFDPALWTQFWEVGEEMSVEEVIRYALAAFSGQNNPEHLLTEAELLSFAGAGAAGSIFSDGVLSTSPVRSPTQAQNKTYGKAQINSLPGRLTIREVEVIKLVATGLTNVQIADKLILSPLTVQAHLRSIYNKLEITTRSAATRYALEKRLV